MRIKSGAVGMIRLPGDADRIERIRGRGGSRKVTLCHVILVVAAALAMLLAYVVIAMSWASYRR